MCKFNPGRSLLLVAIVTMLAVPAAAQAPSGDAKNRPQELDHRAKALDNLLTIKRELVKELNAEKARLEQELSEAIEGWQDDGSDRSDEAAAGKRMLGALKRSIHRHQAEVEQIREQLTGISERLEQAVRQESAEQVVGEPATGDNQADDARQTLVERIEQLQQQMARATEAGKRELAERIRREIREYVAAKAKAGMRRAGEDAVAAIRQQVEALEGTIGQLRERGETRLARPFRDRLARLLQSLGEQESAAEGDASGGPISDAGVPTRWELQQRRDHLREAAEHLSAAGEHALVGQLRLEIDRLGDELQHMPPPAEGVDKQRWQAMERQLQAIHKRLDQLEQDMARLHESVR